MHMRSVRFPQGRTFAVVFAIVVSCATVSNVKAFAGERENAARGDDDDDFDHGHGPPHRSVCAGVRPAGFGLCVAFCEGLNCDVRTRPACDVLRRAFRSVTGQSVFPCEQTPTATATARSTSTATATGTAPPATSTATAVPSSTATATAADTMTPTHTPVPTETNTAIPTGTSAVTATETATAESTATATEVVPTATATGTAAATVTVTPTGTDTAPPAATATATPPAATATPTATPTATETPGAACPIDAGRYTITTTGGTLRVATFAPFAFPAGGTTIQDVSAGDANCVHDTVIPYPGGLTVPVFCVPALGATTSVTQTGCGIGEIDSNGGSDFTITEHGDTSEGTVCNVTQAVCPATGPAPDSSGRLDVTVGDGTADTCASGGTANAIVTIPVNTLTWVAADGSCPDSDGTFNPATDTKLAEFPQTLDLTTDTNTAQFADIDLDGCAKSGLGPTGPFSNTGQCIDLTNNTVNIAASGTVFSSGGPTYDLLFTTVQNNTLSGPAPSGGATCDNPPVIDFSGTATRCLVGP
jgi:hypothetical protein